jgi:hypothetical protein
MEYIETLESVILLEDGIYFVFDKSDNLFKFEVQEVSTYESEYVVHGWEHEYCTEHKELFSELTENQKAEVLNNCPCYTEVTQKSESYIKFKTIFGFLFEHKEQLKESNISISFDVDCTYLMFIDECNSSIDLNTWHEMLLFMKIVSKSNTFFFEKTSI